MSSTHPYYQRQKIGNYHVIANQSDGSHVDLRNVHLDSYGGNYSVAEAVRRFDARTAEFVRSATGKVAQIAVFPTDGITAAATPHSLLTLEKHNTGDVNIANVTCLAALAYGEYFPWDRSARSLSNTVSEAILGAQPGYCGTFGAAPEVTFTSLIDVLWSDEGNYDLTQMHLLQIAYRYYDALTPPAREHLIERLLGGGIIHRPGIDDGDDSIRTSGGAPNDWARAGLVSIDVRVGPIHVGVKLARIGETENHILQIHTVRYLTNQLLYQRDRDPNHDNRRNGSDDSLTCTNLMLLLLRNFLMNDFSEYNAKPYQKETRNALRNLCSYAYDHQVRLAARMVLDYVSAHIAVSSSDLRRMIPFRRINHEENTKLIDGSRMDVGLLEWELGADRCTELFAVQAGNTRAYETKPVAGPPWAPDVYRKRPWSIHGRGEDGMMEGLGDYRLPPCIHDLFITDRHRRFYQRLHRIDMHDERTGQNADNVEVYAGSPSYLISAGGGLAGPALDPNLAAITSPHLKREQLGVAVTTSFMPTGQSAGPDTQNYARNLIQFGSFAERANNPFGNLGVAPDFACGHWVYLPEWCRQSINHSRDKYNANGVFSFVDKKCRRQGENGPGFFLAIYQSSQNLFSVMEAFDTWLHPELEFDEFIANVWERNQSLHLENNVQAIYTTSNNNRIGFVIWFDRNGGDVEDYSFGADIRSLSYGRDPRDENDSIGDASKIGGFLNGTIMNSSGDGKVVIRNPLLNQQITLDWSDPKVLKRTSETGEVEEAREGGDSEVWVDFNSIGPEAEEGDFYRPFRSLSAAVAAVADNGVIKIMPGTTRERPLISGKKRFRMEAAIGGVSIGIR
jgi:hypothetical protein